MTAKLSKNDFKELVDRVLAMRQDIRENSVQQFLEKKGYQEEIHKFHEPVLKAMIPEKLDPLITSLLQHPQRDQSDESWKVDHTGKLKFGNLTLPSKLNEPFTFRNRDYTLTKGLANLFNFDFTQLSEGEDFNLSDLKNYLEIREKRPKGGRKSQKPKQITDIINDLREIEGLKGKGIGMIKPFECKDEVAEYSSLNDAITRLNLLFSGKIIGNQNNTAEVMQILDLLKKNGVIKDEQHKCLLKKYVN